ncbi:MAG: mechanosensitive ion channel family protein [Gammaproteobacteria bacterium]|nr:mechanosensitive ion channel family protein [Gammaproteobacteria bacterium]
MNESIIWLPKVAAVLFIIVLFFVLSRFVKRLIITFSDKLNFDPHLTKFFAQISKILLIIIGLVTALGTVGINVSALVAGLGLTGFALGFAFKDIISNILSGILILLYRPFIAGDKIKVAGYEGEVVSVDLRYTRLNSEEGIALIPNSKCFSDPVVVYNKD